MADAIDRDETTTTSSPEPFEAIEHPFGGYLPGAWMHRRRCPSPARTGRGARPMVPRIWVIERADALLMRAEVADAAKEDLGISLRGESVTIEDGHRRMHGKEGGSHRGGGGRKRRGFCRTVRLPVPVDASKANARLRHGVLELELPKAPRPTPRRLAIE